MKYTLIDNNAKLLSLIDEFKENDINVISLDLEGESYLHIYGIHLCLIQIYDGSKVYIIDPFKTEPKLFKQILENRRLLKVMYDASSDMALLKQTHDIEIKSILDLRPAVELLGYKNKDLHSILNLELEIKLEKKKKFQRYNWTRRPIQRTALGYASNDVYYLFKLKDKLMSKLIAEDLLTKYIHKNINVQNKTDKLSKDKYRKVRGYSRLLEAQKAIFKRVFDIRDEFAKSLNLPPHQLISNDDLLKISQDSDQIGNLEFSNKFDDDLKHRIITELTETVDGLFI